MIDKEQAKRLATEKLWGWRIGEFDDCWASPEEKHHMSEWMLRWYEEEFDWYYSEPEEVPFGWFLRSNLRPWAGKPIGGDYSVIVNYWTSELVYLRAGTPLYDAAPEAYMRCHIERLPDEQRMAAEARMDKLPFAPVRYYPPYIIVSKDDLRTGVACPFTVEFDTKFFERIGIAIPSLTAVYLFYDSKRRLHWVRRKKVLLKVGERQSGGKRFDDYHFVPPLTREDVPLNYTEPRFEIPLVQLDLPEYSGDPNSDETLDELRQVRLNIKEI